MKNKILICLFLGCTFTHFATAQLKSEVNECFELTSIVFRLADVPEYVNNPIQSYANDIDSYFAMYKNNPLILYAKELRAKYGISYDAVAKAAAFLDIKNRKIIVKQDLDVSKISEADSRWTEQLFKTFVTQLNDFYQKTKFRNFYSKHNDLYSVAVNRMDTLLQDIHYDWIKALFGDKNADLPLVVVSLCNGPGNYAFSLKTHNERKRNGIVIGCGADAGGLPYFSQGMIPIIIHELFHPYITPLVSKCWAEIESAAHIIYPYVEEKMQKQAYGSAKIVMSEWLVRLVSILYFQEHPLRGSDIEHFIRAEHNQGFIWMERSVLFMKHFNENRSHYVTLNDFMPQIISFINYSADNFSQILKEYDDRAPYVVDVFPAIGSSIISQNTIEVRFSEAMINAHGLMPIDDKNVTNLPPKKRPFFKDAYTYVIELDTNQIEKNKTYGIKLDHMYFQSKKTYSMKEDFILIFNTYYK